MKICNLLIFSLLSFGFLSCSSEDSITNPQNIVFPESDVKFQNHVLPLLRLTCGVGGCHNATSEKPLTNYTEIVSSTGLVIAGMPNESVLIQFMEGTLPHPGIVNYTYTDNHKTGVRTWIKEGAKNN